MKVKQKANWLDPNTTAENEKLPRFFKWAWSSRAVSMALNVILIMQLTYYCTDMLGMAPLLVGNLLLASKLFDGVTDIIVGFIIDKTNTKLGKARPYEIFVLFVWGFTILLFSAPKLNTIGLCIFVFVLYTLINSICATFLNGGDSVYLARSIRNENNRVSVASFTGVVVMLASIVLSIFMPQLIANIGSTREGWTIIALILGIPLGFIGIFRFIFIKEVAITTEAHTQKKETISVKEGLRCIFHNKYIWIFAGMTFITQVLSNVGSATTTYYFKYIIGNIGLATLVSLSSLVTPIVLIFFPVLARKFGPANLIRIGAVVGIIGYVLRTLGGANLVTLTVGSLLAGVTTLPVGLLGSIYIIDCMDYGEWKTGTRVEGLMSSVNSFTSKLGSGLASGMVGLAMGLVGYDGTLAVQSEAATGMIMFLFNWLPLISTVVLLMLGLAYKLDKELPRIKEELSAKRNA